MTVSDLPRAPSLVRRIGGQPYLLLSLTSLFWAGNTVLGRFAAGHIPPITLSFLRWTFAFLIILPFAWRHLARDWLTIRERLGLMILLSLTGMSILNTLQYTALEHTQALNALLMQSTGPLFVAIWSLLLFGARLTWAQAGGMTVSMIGVLVILLHGDLLALASIDLNKGDLIFLLALAVFGLYTVLIRKRPPMHAMSFLGFTFGCSALSMVPLVVWEMMMRPMPAFSGANLLTACYVAIFPSILAYLCFNRGVQIIGPNRAAPFVYLIPVFGAAMAIMFLGEQPKLFHVTGFVLVLAGVIVASRQSAARAKA